MRLRIVRHAHCDYTAFTGEEAVDPPLSPVGERQAERVARRFQSEPPTAIWSSPTLRGMQTSAAIGSATGVRPRAWSLLAECGFLFGSRGHGRNELQERFPGIDVPEEISVEGWAAGRAEPNDVGSNERAHEVWRVVKAGLEASPDADICLVTHLAIGSYLMRAILQPADPTVAFGLDNTGVTSIRFRTDVGSTRLEYVNCRRHLD